MKKYINKLKGFFLLVLVLGANSCGDSYLEEVDRYSIDSESYFNSETDYYNALVGAYDLLQSTYLNVVLGEIASDNTLCGGESATDVVAWQQIDDMIHTPVNAELKKLWEWMYAGVNRANFILEFQDKTDFEGKEIILGEAHFLRAYYYFELVKWFGDVPLKETRFVLGDETSVPRSPAADVYALIEADLKYAVNNLNYIAPQVGRATKGSAQALLGKAYLYQNKFTEATTVLDQLITEGPYDLVSDYDTIFETDGENNIESVFEVQYSDAEGAGFECLQCSEGNVAVGFNGIRNYTGPTFDSGFSFNVPTQEVVDEFEAGDLRKDVAILDIEAWATANNATYGEGNEHTGYFNRKYIARKGDLNTGDQNLTNPNNYRAIRFADVLLMAAEAYNRGEISDSKAQGYLNRVRERAFGTANDVTSTGATLTDAIAHERRVELVGEGHRFFDLVRTGRGAEIDGFTAGKNEVFPIPIEEIQFSNGNWVQNDNY
ncbi:RagB/SusD family nutrient uptake outer membrane protein [Algibacter lectus]|uniref:Putative outer membrane starch-binding protein n=1 Tax=Algibacter lectus TaxID=221126 RepID=A0A4R8MA54_9FLAO|nr:RagB/SusD family nutrient uptake outer membrane protein [Algibacter lectus]MWW24494.1 RagB/SusD family nutrient uptake outer membrane protein [Algibacter lectus]TDY62513.1 putative outer membrane starch-binding protein [Algibacter lectus]